MPSIPVIPYQEQGQAGAIAREEAQDRINNPHLWDQGFENEMESKKGLFGLKDMLNSKDQAGNTLFQNLLQTAGTASNKAKPFLEKFSNFIWGDPNTTLDGAPMPGGYNQDYLNLPYETRKRFDESMMN